MTHLLQDYFQSEKPQEIGIPSVGFFANELHLSTKYFGDLIKKETGKTAQEYIQAKLIDVAREKIFVPNKTASEKLMSWGLNIRNILQGFLSSR